MESLGRSSEGTSPRRPGAGYNSRYRSKQWHSRGASPLSERIWARHSLRFLKTSRPSSFGLSTLRNALFGLPGCTQLQLQRFCVCGGCVIETTFSPLTLAERNPLGGSDAEIVGRAFPPDSVGAEIALSCWSRNERRLCCWFH